MKLRSIAAFAVGAAMLVGSAVVLNADSTAAGPPPPIASDAAVVYGPPVTITQGGTYSPSSTGVTIATTQPVVLERCFVKATNRHLVNVWAGANVTIRDCRFEGSATPNDAGYRGIWAQSAASITVTNNEFLHISAVKVVGGAPTISILNNRVRDVIGDETNCCGGGYAPAFQLANLTSANTEIAWNEVVNLPGQSNMEDGINLFAASGASASTPLRIHDNFIWGAYPLPITSGYSGGGILTGDGGGGTNNIVVTGNQLVGTTNYGIQIGGGNNVRFTDNRAVASGVTASGQEIPAQNTNSFWTYNTPPSNSTMSNNVWGWMRGPASRWPTGKWYRADSWMPACGTNGNTCTGNQSLTSDAAARITYADERAEWDRWVAKVATAGQTIGRKGPPATTTTTAPPTTSSTTTTAPSTTTSSTTTTAPTTTSTVPPTTTTTLPACVDIPTLAVKVCPL